MFNDKCPYILNLFINELLSEEETKRIIYTINDMIEEKEIEKRLTLFGTNITMRWSLINHSNLLQYYAIDSSGLLSDEGVYEHTKQVLNDVRQIVGKNKFSFIITKPLTRKLCMM